MFAIHLVPLLLAACAPDYDTIMHDWAIESGLAFTDCGTVDVGQCTVAQGQAPAVVLCLVDGYNTCTATRAQITQDSVEGDPIVETWYVTPKSDDTCNLTVFRGTTADEFGPQEITRSECSAIAPNEDCPWFTSSGCGDPLETW